MKKIISALLVLIMLMASMGTVGFAAEEHISIFVEQGATNGDGSIASPFGSFNEARDYIRALKADGSYPEKGVTVNFREGNYIVSESMVLDENDSGTENGLVVYKPYKDENVSFIGGAEVPLADFKKVTDEGTLKRLHTAAKDKIVCVNLKEYGISEYGSLNPYGNMLSVYNVVGFPYTAAGQNELFFGGERMMPARWPNEGIVKIEEVISEGTVLQNWRDDEAEQPEGWVPPEERNPEAVEGPAFTIKDQTGEKPWKRWAEAKDIMLHGRLRYDWSDEGMPVFVSEEGVVTSDWPVSYGVRTAAEFYLWNILEELDLPGEWYLDRESGALYFYPVDGADGSVLLSILETPILDIKNVENVVIKGFRMEASKSHGINILNSTSVVLEDLSVKNVSKNGIYSENLKNCKVLDCTITGCGEIGATIDGGEKQKFIRANNVISNCHIYGNAKLKETYAPAIRLTGCGNTASHNLIHDMPHAGIVFNGSYNTVEYNELHNVVSKSNDMGAIYSYRLRTHVGCVVRNNYIHDLVPIDEGLRTNVLQPGVYLDGGRSFVTVESNIFENIPGVAILQSGRANNIKNNLFINVGYAMYTGTGTWTEWTYQNLSDTGLQAVYNGKLDLSVTPYSEVEHFSNILEDDPLASKYVVYENNVFVNPPAVKEFWWRISDGEAFPWESDEDNEPTFNEWKRRSESIFEETKVVSMEEAGFVDAENKNYSLKEDSLIYKLHSDFKGCDIENVGLLTKKIEEKLDGAIALKIDSPKVYVDVKTNYIDKENAKVVPYIEGSITYLPLRFIAESLESRVEWKNEKSTAVVKAGESTLEANVKTGEIFFNGAQLDGKAMLKENRTFVPLRVIMEAFGKEVSWYNERIIIISGAEFPVAEDNMTLIEALGRIIANDN